MSERDSRRIIRQWNREIDDDNRRRRALDNAGGGWKSVVWASLWGLWLALLVALLAHLKALG